MTDNNSQLDDIKVEAYGTFALPPGMTQEEADRLVREADAQRKDQ